MALVGVRSAYTTDIVTVQQVYYNQTYNFGCKTVLSLCSHAFADVGCVDQWMVVMSTQLIGFSIGGIARRFLVQPPSMSMRHLSIYL